jgi:hypothetical protein
MYGVRDNFNRTKSVYGPELTKAMKAKRNAIVIIVLGALAVFGGGWLLITTTPVSVWVPILVVLGSAGFILFMVTKGFEMLSDGFEWIGSQFSTWNDAREYGVRDE